MSAKIIEASERRLETETFCEVFGRTWSGDLGIEFAVDINCTWASYSREPQGSSGMARPND